MSTNTLDMEASSPWKPCDLRGVFPESVSEHLFEQVGKAIGSEVAEGGHVVVGGDFRLSTLALKSSLIRGLVSTGLHVMDVGQAPTPVVYFTSARLAAAAVFIVTASHNPAAHNGLKWMVGERPPTPADIQRIQSATLSGTFRQGRGTVEVLDPVPSYREWITSRWKHLRTARRTRVILDAGSGAWAQLAPQVFRDLDFDIVSLHGDPDGRFPHRSPDCARTKNLAALQAAVVDHGATLGIAWDGDGDRVAFVDEHGVHASTDEVSILFARQVLKSAEPGGNVVCDIKLSDSVRREVLGAGGDALLERSGHAFMRGRLLASRALLGLDACGHYFFREGGSRDDGLYGALYMLGILGDERTLAELCQSIGPIFSTPELRLPSSILNYDVVRDRLHAEFPDAEQSNIDGTRLMLKDGVILARESSTEAVVSLRIEGFSSRGYSELVTRCLASLRDANNILLGQIGELPGRVPLVSQREQP